MLEEIISTYNKDRSKDSAYVLDFLEKITGLVKNHRDFALFLSFFSENIKDLMSGRDLMEAGVFLDILSFLLEETKDCDVNSQWSCLANRIITALSYENG